MVFRSNWSTIFGSIMISKNLPLIYAINRFYLLLHCSCCWWCTGNFQFQVQNFLQRSGRHKVRILSLTVFIILKIINHNLYIKSFVLLHRKSITYREDDVPRNFLALSEVTCVVFLRLGRKRMENLVIFSHLRIVRMSYTNESEVHNTCVHKIVIKK